jgi:hypothetical protein
MGRCLKKEHLRATFPELWPGRSKRCDANIINQEAFMQWWQKY